MSDKKEIVSDEVDLRDVVNVLLLGKWWVGFFSLVFLFLAYVYVTFATPIYSADALVQVESGKPALGGLSELTEVLPASGAIGGEVEIIRSRSILGEVVNRRNLDLEARAKRFPLFGEKLSKSGWEGLPRFLYKVFPGYSWGRAKIEIGQYDIPEYSRPITLNIRAITANELLVASVGSDDWVARKVGEPIAFPGGGYLNIRGVDFDPGLGGNFKISINPSLKSIARLAANLSVSELGRDTGILKIRLEGEDREEIVDIVDAVANTYLKKNVERRSAEAQQSIAFLDDQLPTVRDELELAEERLARFREDNKTIDLSVETEAVLKNMVSIDQRLSELDLKRSELLRIYTREHPLVQTLNEQKEQLANEKVELEKESSQYPDVQQDLLRLMREVEVKTQLYTYMLNKVQELRVVRAGTIGNVRILDDSAAAVTPVKPRKPMTLVVYALLGMVVGSFVVLIRGFFTKGISDPDEVERDLGIPVYAVLPQWEDAGRRTKNLQRIVAGSDKDTVIAETFRSLRTSLHFAVGNLSGGVTISLCGPAPNVGKTFISANVAISVAEVGVKVLFVDCDLRRGDSNQVFGVSNSVGLSDLLRGAPADSAYQKMPGVSGLTVVTRGKSPPNPAELLMSEKFQLLLKEWRVEYDVIIIDTPPVLAVTDPVIVAKLVDSTFLIGRAGLTHIKELRESVSRFERGGGGVKGLIVNGMTPKLAKTGNYGYGYGYYSYEYSAKDE